MESNWSLEGLQWTPGGLQVDSRKFSSNMTIFMESWWTPDGVHLEYVEKGKVYHYLESQYMPESV